MQLPVIQIGNSKGIRFSKAILSKYHITDKVEVALEDDRIVITPGKNPREGWEESFKEMVANGDDKLLIDDVFEDETWL